jgi:hypothetical protein
MKPQPKSFLVSTYIFGLANLLYRSNRLIVYFCSLHMRWCVKHSVFTILASEGTPKFKEAKAKEGDMVEQEATTQVVSGMLVHLRPCYLSQPCLYVGLELLLLLFQMVMGS